LFRSCHVDKQTGKLTNKKQTDAAENIDFAPLCYITILGNHLAKQHILAVFKFLYIWDANV